MPTPIIENTLIPVGKIRKTKHLRKGRLSLPFARYFVTCCTHSRKEGLTDTWVAEKIRETLRQQHREKDFEFLCATFMPDHCHLLFRLLDRITLSQTIGKFKTLTTAALESRGLIWQDNFYDHRLRSDASAEAFARYIFLNPYRNELLGFNHTWPWWICNREYRPEFQQYLNHSGGPPKEWIATGETVEDLIEADVLEDL